MRVVADAVVSQHRQQLVLSASVQRVVHALADGGQDIAAPVAILNYLDHLPGRKIRQPEGLKLARPMAGIDLGQGVFQRDVGRGLMNVVDRHRRQSERRPRLNQLHRESARRHGVILRGNEQLVPAGNSSQNLFAVPHLVHPGGVELRAAILEKRPQQVLAGLVACQRMVARASLGRPESNRAQESNEGSMNADRSLRA